MRAYRLRHKPTGLFFKQSKHRSKSNLSKEGKLYLKRPSVKMLDYTYHHPSDSEEIEYRKVRAHEWEVVEYELVEVDQG